GNMVIASDVGMAPVEDVLEPGAPAYHEFPCWYERRPLTHRDLAAFGPEIVPHRHARTEHVDSLVRLAHAAVRPVGEVDSGVQAGLPRHDVPQIEAPVDASVHVRAEHGHVGIRLLIEGLPVPRDSHAEIGRELYAFGWGR